MENYDTNKQFFALKMIDHSVARIRDKLTSWGVQEADLQEVQGLDGWSTVFFGTKEERNGGKIKFCLAYRDDDGTVHIYKHKGCGIGFFGIAVTYLLHHLSFFEDRQADAVDDVAVAEAAVDDVAVDDVAEADAVAAVAVDVAEAKEDDAAAEAVAEEPAPKRNRTDIPVIDLTL
ncbi:MAG: hypothetical protein EBY22_14120 [Gammaproteobacteria bacterium]|nr:hypothetical protein [Gammaproteobacteria bacterium]